MGAKKGLKNKSPDAMQEIRFDLSAWHHEKLTAWADENGMTVRAALRFIINQFIKTGQFNLLKSDNESR